VKIAILSRYSHPFHRYGGLERMVFHHCKTLEAAGVEVTLFTEPPFPGASDARPASVVRFVPALRIPFRYAPGQVIPDRILNYPWWSLRAGRIVAREAVRAGFDVVQGNGVAAFGYALERARRPALPPLVFNPPGFEEFETPSRAKYLAYGWFRSMFRYAARHADRVAAPDDCLVDKTVRYTGVPLERVFVLRNGVLLEECLGHVSEARQRELRRRYDLDGSPFTLLSIGRISANKGFDVLAGALGKLRERLPAGWRWVHVGEGTGRADLEALASRIDIAANTRFTGFVDEPTKHNLLELAEVFVHPALYEGSSIVTVEALAHARPIVATRAGGIPDKVIDGENGRLITPGDPQALASAISEIAAMSTSERERWGERSRRLCAERFLCDRIAIGLIERYKEILDGG
jgi:glycosyltransferase involved in cell wall biosynthesis